MLKNCKIDAINTQKWNIECKYFFFLPIPYNIAPTVYTTPPKNNSNIPTDSKLSNIELIENIIDQPIIRYSAKDGFLNFSKLIEFNKTPTIAHTQTTENIIQPFNPSITHKQYGVYEPAIKT